MKPIFLLLFVTLFQYLSFAERFENASLKDVEDKVLSYRPDETLVILDLDGTLTNHAQPSLIGLAARGNAKNFVQDIIEKGYTVVVSSAWDNFDETLGRIKFLGLDKHLGVNDSICANRNLCINDFTAKFHVCQSGNVISVRDLDNKDPYYRKKAFSFLYVDPSIDISKIQHVVFADDSSGNVSTFRKDAHRAKLFRDAELDTFTLSPPKTTGNYD